MYDGSADGTGVHTVRDFARASGASVGQCEPSDAGSQVPIVWSRMRFRSGIGVALLLIECVIFVVLLAYCFKKARRS